MKYALYKIVGTGMSKQYVTLFIGTEKACKKVKHALKIGRIKPMLK